LKLKINNFTPGFSARVDGAVGGAKPEYPQRTTLISDDIV